MIGLDHPIPIVSFVPLLMFAILFGLSMDYQVFLVSRIGERYIELDRDNHEAVVEGLATSARVITSAALIMVFVFSSFILNGNPTVKQFGVGMAAAIAIDATIVRCLLVPSVMMLLGAPTGGCRAGWSGSCRASASRPRTRCRRCRSPGRHRGRSRSSADSALGGEVGRHADPADEHPGAEVGAEDGSDLGAEQRLGLPKISLPSVDQVPRRPRGTGRAGRSSRWRRARCSSSQVGDHPLQGPLFVRTWSTGAISVPKVRIGLIFSAEPTSAWAAPIRPPRRRYSRVSRQNQISRHSRVVARPRRPPLERRAELRAARRPRGRGSRARRRRSGRRRPRSGPRFRASASERAASRALSQVPESPAAM